MSTVVKNIWVEGIVTLASIVDIGDERHRIQGTIQGKRFHINEFEVENPKNSGGEIWEWAQKNWPDLIDNSEMDLYVVVEDETLPIPLNIRWICITGVLNKNGDSLPIIKEYPNKKKTKVGKNTSKKPIRQKHISVSVEEAVKKVM